MGHQHGLHAVADQLAGGEAVLHAHMAHGDAVADADGRDEDGGAACHLDTGLDGLGDLIQIHVAGDDLAVGAHHADEGAVQLFRGVAQSVKQAAVGRAFRAFGHVVTSHFILLMQKAPESAAFLLKPTLKNSTSQSASQTASLPRGASGEEMRLYDMPRPPLARGGGSASALTERFC